jgi:hypothetical protein
MTAAIVSHAPILSSDERVPGGMIGAFLEKIGGFFDRPFLVAGVLPWLIVTAIVGAFFVPLLGVDAVAAWARTLSAANSIGLVFAAGMVLILLAFALRSLRALIISSWSGEGRAWTWTGIGEVLKETQRARHDALTLRAEANEWGRAKTSLRLRVAETLGSGAEAMLPDNVEATWRTRIDALASRFRRGRLTFAELDNHIAVFAEAYTRYSVDALIPIYRRFNDLVNEMTETEESEGRTALVDRDLYFASAATMWPTELGNILAALNSYPFKRYKMEGSLFWPHLEEAMSESVRAEISNQRAMLDLALSLATLFLVLTLAAAFVGPWFIFHWFWIAATIGGIAFAFAFYRVAVHSAIAFSRSMRAACDLSRHKLLAALSLPFPTTLEAEQELWLRMSRLVAYGGARDVKFEQRSKP